jgi:hypothetical protein
MHRQPKCEVVFGSGLSGQVLLKISDERIWIKGGKCDGLVKSVLRVRKNVTNF